MWFDRLTDRLRALYRGTTPDPKDMSSGQDALERRLLAEHARLYPPVTATPATGRVRRFLGAHRWAVTGVGAALATAAACQVPVDYEREFGASITCELSAETWPEGQMDATIHALADSLGAARVAVRVKHEGGPMRSFRMDLWGADVDDDGLVAALRAHTPSIPPDACTRTPLAGTVHGTLGGRLGHDLLDLDLDRADAETARAEILEELERQGLAGEARVEVRDHGHGRREVEIRIEAHERHTDEPTSGP